AVPPSPASRGFRPGLREVAVFGETFTAVGSCRRNLLLAKADGNAILRPGKPLIMSITIQLDLPEGLIQQARQMGLLDGGRVAELLAEEVRRRKAGQDFKKVLDEVRSAPGEPPTMDEVSAEVKAARAERRRA